MQKHEKCLKSKNDIKRRLGAINQSYEQILNLIIRKFKSNFPLRKQKQRSCQLLSHLPPYEGSYTRLFSGSM